MSRPALMGNMRGGDPRFIDYLYELYFKGTQLQIRPFDHCNFNNVGWLDYGLYNPKYEVNLSMFRNLNYEFRIKPKHEITKRYISLVELNKAPSLKIEELSDVDHVAFTFKDGVLIDARLQIK